MDNYVTQEATRMVKARLDCTRADPGKFSRDDWWEAAIDAIGWLLHKPYSFVVNTYGEEVNTVFETIRHIKD